MSDNVYYPKNGTSVYVNGIRVDYNGIRVPIIDVKGFDNAVKMGILVKDPKEMNNPKIKPLEIGDKVNVQPIENPKVNKEEESTTNVEPSREDAKGESETKTEESNNVQEEVTTVRRRGRKPANPVE